MVDISGFLTFMEEYSKENDLEIEISFNTNWNKNKGIYVCIYNFCDDGDENYLIDCKITDKGYYFRNIADWNVDILEQLLSCMKYENRGMLPDGIFINGYDYSPITSFDSVKDLLNYYTYLGYNDEDEDDYGEEKNDDE